MHTDVRQNDRCLLESRFFKVCQFLLAALFAGMLSDRLASLTAAGISYAALPLLCAAFLLAARRAARAGEKSRLWFSVLTNALACTYGFLFFRNPGRSVFWALLYGALCVLFHAALWRRVNGRTLRTACVLGTLFSLFLFLGYQLNVYRGLEILHGLSEDRLVLYGVSFWLLRAVANAVFFSSLLLLCFDRLLEHSLVSEEKPRFTRRQNRLRIAGLTALFFCCWLPIFALYYPGILSPDSVDELSQQLGLVPLNSSNPILHQLVIGACLRVGRLLGSLTLGVALYTVLQMLLLAFSAALCVHELYRRGAGHLLTGLSIAFFALHIAHAYMSVTMWKDPPFAAFTLLLMILLLRETDGAEESPRAARRSALLLILVGFLFSTVRHNGFAAFLISFPVFALVMRDKRKKYAAVFFSVLLLYGAYQQFLVKSLDPVPMRSAEALSIPLQQAARVTSTAWDEEADSEEFAILREVWPELESIPERYNPQKADPVKAVGVFSSETFDADPGRYARAWLALGKRHPVTYLEAFLMLNYGYWYPDAGQGAIYGAMNAVEQIGLTRDPAKVSLADRLYELVWSVSAEQPLSILYGTGFTVWLLMFCAAVLHIKGQRKRLALMAPLAVIWLEMFGAAVYAEYRYVYPLVVSMPLFFCLALMLPNER